ncbi:MAG: surface-adhesin E family protein, partial [Burkholderiaceae bacterium]
MQTSRTAFLLTGFFFLALSGNALADWTRFGDDDTAVLYIDPQKITRTADQASMWVLKDFQHEQIGSSRERFRSAKIYYEF